MAWAQIQTFVVATEFNGLNNVTTVVTLGSAVAVGDTIYLQTMTGDVADATTLAALAQTVQDNLAGGGNIYSRLTIAQGGSLVDTANLQGTDGWVCIVTKAGTPTITFTPNGISGKPFIGIQGAHYTGSDASSTRRDSKGAAQNNPGSGAGAIQTASVGASSGDLLLGSSNDAGNGSNTETIGSGFTAGAPINATLGALTEYKTASGAEQVKFTDTAGGSHFYMTIGVAISPASGGGSAITSSESPAVADTQSWNTAQSQLTTSVSVNDLAAFTELGIAAIGGTGDVVGVGESPRANLNAVVSDSAGLIEQSQVPTGNAIVTSDGFFLVEPASTAVGFADADTETLAEALQPRALVSAVDVESVADIATSATKSASAITDTDGATLAESARAVLGTSTADALAVADAIRALLDSLSTDSLALAEQDSPSFAGVGYSGQALGLADIVGRLDGLADTDPGWLGTADLGL